MNKSNEWGKEAERIAREYLVREGLPVRESNWRPAPNSHLEVDIITQEGDAMVFVEVKARTSPDEDPAEALDAKKIRNVVKAADTYLRSQEHMWSYRFDVILVTGDVQNFTLEHIREAFMPPLNTKEQ